MDQRKKAKRWDCLVKLLESPSLQAAKTTAGRRCEYPASAMTAMSQIADLVQSG